jgi:ATP-binding cassette subfamily F protein uup
MTKLLTLNEVSLAYGMHPLLDKVKLDMYKDERLCLIGRNGEGKSSPDFRTFR